jgi:hypothetical protein
MSPASVLTHPVTALPSLFAWAQKALNTVRSAFTAAPGNASPPQKTRHLEAQKLRAMAHSMMRIDAGYAADMFVAADRLEFGHLA